MLTDPFRLAPRGEIRGQSTYLDRRRKGEAADVFDKRCREMLTDPFRLAPCPTWFGYNIPSSREADEELLQYWKDKAAKDDDNWNGLRNCRNVTNENKYRGIPEKDRPKKENPFTGAPR